MPTPPATSPSSPLRHFLSPKAASRKMRYVRASRLATVMRTGDRSYAEQRDHQFLENVATELHDAWRRSRGLCKNNLSYESFPVVSSESGLQVDLANIQFSRLPALVQLEWLLKAEAAVKWIRIEGADSPVRKWALKRAGINAFRERKSRISIEISGEETKKVAKSVIPPTITPSGLTPAPSSSPPARAQNKLCSESAREISDGASEKVQRLAEFVHDQWVEQLVDRVKAKAKNEAIRSESLMNQLAQPDMCRPFSDLSPRKQEWARELFGIVVRMAKADAREKLVLHASAGESCFHRLRRRIASAFDVPKGYLISYEVLFWTVFIALNVLAILDRYSAFSWLDNAFYPKRGCSTVNPGCVDGELHTDDWRVLMFDHIARISGRMSIVATSALFFTQCRASLGWWHRSIFKPSWLYCSDIVASNNRLHWYIAIYFLGIPIVLHVWSIFFPFFLGVDLQKVGTFGWAKSIWLSRESAGRPKGVSFAGKREDGTYLITIDGDDTYRFIVMNLLFAFAFPLTVSVWGRRRSWTVTQSLHIFGALLFAWDIIRRNSHPHSHVWNTPFVLYWMLDKIGRMYFVRRGRCAVVRKVNLGLNYTLLLCKATCPLIDAQDHAAGNVYELNFLRPPCDFELGHPFTTWHFRSRNFRLPHLHNLHKTNLPHHHFRIDVRQGNLPSFDGSADVDNECKGSDDSFESREGSSVDGDRWHSPAEDEEDCIEMVDMKEKAAERELKGCGVCKKAEVVERCKSPGKRKSIIIRSGFLSWWQKLKERYSLKDIIALGNGRDRGSNSIWETVSQTEKTIDGKRKWSTDFDFAVIVARVFPADPSKLTCCPGISRTKTFTDDLFFSMRKHSLRLTFSGPWHSSYSRITRDLGRDAAAVPPLILVATGAGAAYLLDVQQFILAKGIVLTNPIEIHFVTRDPILFQFVTDILCAEKVHNLTVTASLTSLTKNGTTVYKEIGKEMSELQVGRTCLETLAREAPEGCEMYFCGNSHVKRVCTELCRLHGVFFHEGHIIEG